ncbi:hypothetical protein CC86DRAFT_376436 [Ophiobolus disseminans]|uniref:G-protein coupled receptors family 1 profile domain-containing protein n=1 Tax=Ophiobolus disseminans TaxID=1469910 RepID=A0A6A7AIX6_9PLEO|nr:hypothetical protein CC86DRAFT_376436 [Ophiobolus disseminans]
MHLFACPLLILFALSASLVHGGPLLAQRQAIDVRDESALVPAGVPASNRTIYIMIALVCMGLLSFLLGSRFNRLKRSIFMKRNFISMLVLVIYTLVLIFIILSAVLVAGQGLHNFRLCVAGTWVCLILYTFTKFAIFLFLVERIHVVRAPFVRRKKDKIYLACLATVILMYGPVIVNSYIRPVTNMGSSGTRCNFGIRGDASIPVLAVNMFVDLVLTGVFFYLLRPVVKLSPWQTVTNILRSRPKRNIPLEENDTHETPVQRNIRILLWKSIIGSLLIEVPMIANMVQFVITKGEELGMICTALCVVEVVWDILVIHWLAFGPSAQAQRDLERSVTALSKAPLTQPQSRAQTLKIKPHNVEVDAQEFLREMPMCVDSSADMISLELRDAKRVP